MNEERIKEVFSDEKFVSSLMELETPEEVQNALAEKDIDLSTDEIKKLAEMLQKKACGELTDEDLENVAGGSVSIAFAATVLASALAYTVISRRRW